MSLRKFLLSRLFFRQMIFAAIIFIVLIFLILLGLKKYTRHGEFYPVPSFSGLTHDEIAETARKYNVRAEIIDSIHVADALPGVVVDQDPRPGLKVKVNRLIYLTINSILPEQVTLPKLTDISFRQAQVLIENCGLLIGQISYEPSEYKDLVLKIQQNNMEILPGELLPKGTSIDLVIGRDEGNMATPLPDLTGLTVAETKLMLTNAMLNTGVFIYDETVISTNDTLNARVWKQQPNPKITSTINLGTSVDVWLTINQLKIDDATGLEF